MSPTALLLRVLLCLALVLNGIGSSMAAVHVPAAPMDASLAQALASDAGAPCHEEGQAPAQEKGDCCHGARCDCACTLAAANFDSVPLVALAMPPVALAMHRLDAGHRAPALAHPIRPPIV
jgi:hypothetical protein